MVDSVLNRRIVNREADGQIDVDGVKTGKVVLMFVYR